MSTCSIIIVKLYKIEEDDEGTSNATPVLFHKIKVRKVLDERVRFSIQIHSNVRKVSFELQSDIAVPFHLVDLEPVQGIFFFFFSLVKPNLNDSHGRAKRSLELLNYPKMLCFLLS
ncbi:hypothetical protein PVK06_011798 [Gossypium arboreum]|uniref:Uncharacterized protein n=1 Tax=Gossypium arboreum TaxID=29729 RepID=A0ABR0Q9U0_GOSAR|nr:hypothetical protein PVK06_011798 [Gossypium arboreum]